MSLNKLSCSRSIWKLTMCCDRLKLTLIILHSQHTTGAVDNQRARKLIGRIMFYSQCPDHEPVGALIFLAHVNEEYYSFGRFRGLSAQDGFSQGKCAPATKIPMDERF